VLIFRDKRSKSHEPVLCFQYACYFWYTFWFKYLKWIINDKETLDKKALPHTIVIFNSIVNLVHKNFLKSTTSTFFHAFKCWSSLVLKLRMNNQKYCEIYNIKRKWKGAVAVLAKKYLSKTNPRHSKSQIESPRWMTYDNWKWPFKLHPFLQMGTMNTTMKSLEYKWKLLSKNYPQSKIEPSWCKWFNTQSYLQMNG
jgi:hypothetical protein